MLINDKGSMLDLILLENDEVESDNKKNGDDDRQPGLGKRKHLATPLLHILNFLFKTPFIIYMSQILTVSVKKLTQLMTTAAT